ncbi:MAG: PQQ-like beta-propeller repeat protein [Pirellulaceae bacterium]|nr:PQQ-like beta-propeller repeat protein [Pirellulaceae bacterium]
MKFFCFVVVGIWSVGGVTADDWPQWRGPNRTDVSNEAGLLKSWPADGPKRDWLSKAGGLGYSGFSVVGNHLFTMGLEIGGDDEFVVCLDVKNGETKWKTNVAKIFKNGWGDGPRSTPTIDDGHCYVVSGNGVVACLKSSDGTVVWEKTMQDLGGKTPFWGYCESVLVDGKNMICTPGGKDGAVVALNKKTGEIVWQSKDFQDGAQYSSPIKAVINNQPQYIQLTMKSLVSLSPVDGSVLWKSDWPGQTAVIPTPIVKGNRVYVSSGYRVGCMSVEVAADNSVKQVWKNQVMVNHHGGVILVGEHLFGYSDGRKGGWTCQSFADGEQVWAENKALSKGAIAYADGKFYCLSESKGEVVLIDAAVEGWKEAGRFKLEPQTENRSNRGKIWVHPVIANGKMFLRDQELIYCYDISP